MLLSRNPKSQVPVSDLSEQCSCEFVYYSDLHCEFNDCFYCVGAWARSGVSTACRRSFSISMAMSLMFKKIHACKLADVLNFYLTIAINKSMRIFELEKPKSPEQLRLDQLRATSKRASDALKIERDRQKAQRAQKTLQKLRSPALNTPV